METDDDILIVDRSQIQVSYSIFFTEGIPYIHDGYGYPIDINTIAFVERLLEKTKSLISDPEKLADVTAKNKELNKYLDDKVASLLANPEAETFVYLARDASLGTTKIGFTKNLKKRLAQLKVANTSISFIKTYSGTFADEQKLLMFFKESGKHVKGEWFNLSDSDITYISEYFKPLPF